MSALLIYEVDNDNNKVEVRLTDKNKIMITDFDENDNPTDTVIISQSLIIKLASLLMEQK